MFQVLVYMGIQSRNQRLKGSCGTPTRYKSKVQISIYEETGG